MTVQAGARWKRPELDGCGFDTVRDRVHRPTGHRPGAIVAVVARLATLLLVLFAVTAAGTARADAPRQEDTGSASTAEQELAERFVPVIMLKEQSEACDPEGEPYGPTAVDIVLDNPEVALRQVGPYDPVVKRAPGAADLVGLGEGFFLDFPGSSLSPGCIYERDFDKYSADVPATVYAHVVQQPDEPGLVFVQYWFYWYYNDWNNKHESDWEGITLKFEAASVDDALSSEPVAVGYSQHEGGERSEWDDPKLERVGDRPVVYSSAGSHASYFDEAVYLGRGASEGFGCDDTSGPSVRVDPAVVVLPDAVDNPDDPLAWLSFDGRWGERQSGPFNGPTGPAVKDRWLEPAPWFEELRSTSVVIPATDSDARSVIDVFCGAVEAGSRTLIAFTVSPARVIVGFGILVLLVSFAVKRTVWNRVVAEPVDRRRRAGEILRLAARTYLGRPIPFLIFGLVYIPAVIIAGLIGALIAIVPVLGSVVSLAEGSNGANLVLALFAGSVAHVGAFVAINGLVAHYLRSEHDGMDAVGESIRATWGRRRELVGAFTRTFLIVAALLFSIVGIPWGIRQVVRYQFIGQSVMVDDSDGSQALSRSSELVTGRWLHTAVVTAVLNGLIAATALVFGLLLLILAAGLPLWLFSALMSLVSVLIVPLASIAMGYLHGDARAEHHEEARAEVLVG